MKTVFLLSALACAVLAAPGHNSNRRFGDSGETFEIREKKSPTFKHPVAIVQPIPLHVAPIHTPLHQPLLHHGLGFKKPHLGLLREADENAQEHLVQSKETENQQNVEESIQMAKTAFDNLENDLNNIEDPEKSENIEKARQALEDARKSFAELQSMRITSPIADKAVTLPTTDLRKIENERMVQWKDHKETVQRNEELSVSPKVHKAIEMEESASNKKESFRAPDGLDNLPNHNFHKNSEQVNMNKSIKEVTSSIEEPKNAEEVEKVKQQTKNLETEDMKAKNIFNRNSASLAHDSSENKKVQNSNMEKKVNLNEHPRASSQVLDVPKQPQQKDVKPQLSNESRPMMPVDNNTKQKDREIFKSAEHIDSKWSSTQNKEQIVKGKSAESEHTVGNHENQFMAVPERANQADPLWPPGFKINMRNQEGELMRENMQWKHLPQSDMRSAYGASYGIGGAGGSSGAGIINSGAGIIGGGAGAGSGGAGAIGIFPNAQVSNCAIPLLLSCSPSVVSGSLGKSYSSSYGSSASAGAYGSSAGAYRSGGEVNHPAKRDAKNLNRIELTKTKRTASKDQQYRMVSKKY